MNIHRGLLFSVVLCMLFVFTSCDPDVKYPTFEFDYDDSVLIKIPEDQRGNHKTLDDDYSINIDSYESGSFQIYKDGIEVLSLKLGKKENSYKYHYLQGNRNYLIINAWQSSLNGVTRYEHHTGSVIVYLNDLSYVEFGAGQVPLIISQDLVYYFEELSICSRVLTDDSTHDILYTLPFTKSIPNYNYDTENRDPDIPNFNSFIFTISEKSISLDGDDANYSRDDPEHLKHFTTIDLGN